MNDKNHDRELGMEREITRRDFLNGISIALGTSLVANSTWVQAFGIPQPALASAFAPEKEPGYYPPFKTGMRGSHDGSWEVAHELRDGNGKNEDWANPINDGESYDLVIVGGGISGLAAAYFYRKFAGQQSKILILDNHDDFGGHAKRNEFQAEKRLLLGYGGTQSIEARRFFKYYNQNLFDSMHLQEAVFFDKETFGTDRLLRQKSLHYFAVDLRMENVSQMPIAEAARKDLLRLQHASIDYLPELAPDKKQTKLIKTSYKDFLLQYAKVHPDVVKVLQASTHDLYCVGIDAVSAHDCAREGFPGFKGMTLPKSHEENPE